MALYKSNQDRQNILNLYDEKLASLAIPYKEIDIPTSYGQTRVVKTGNENGKPIVLFHGINAGAPITIEPIKELLDEFLVYAVDTIGQTTKSAETPINILDNSYGLWANEVLEDLGLGRVNCVGISYGGYIAQKLISTKPERVSKCVLIVPGGLVNGAFIPSMKKLMFPLMKYRLFKRDKDLKAFLKAFVPDDNEHMFKLQKAMLTGINLDMRRPTLLKESDVANFTDPVYLMVADDDVFFPGDLSITRAKQLFKNLKDIHILKNTKHIPHKALYPELQTKLRGWLNER